MTMDNQTQQPSACDPRDGVLGTLAVKSANEWLLEASQRPEPRRLWQNLWFEGEICCLFADSNVGKTILAVQMGEHVAAMGLTVLYLDLELTEKQFQLRYTDDRGRLYPFPATFYRGQVHTDTTFNGASYEDDLLESIEMQIKAVEPDVIIIDNLTAMCNDSERGDAAGFLMQNLMEMKRRWGLSVLVLSHTPKRDLSQPITQNDLAGSKRIFNFCDSVFAIGMSARDSSMRYLKQLKARSCPIEYDASHVQVHEIIKEEGFLQFYQTGFATEREHLRETGARGITEADRERIRELSASGLSVRKIAEQTGLGKTTVSKYLHSL